MCALTRGHAVDRCYDDERHAARGRDLKCRVGIEARAPRSLTHTNKAAPPCARDPLSYPSAAKLEPFC